MSASCNNPITVNTTHVGLFGFSTTFDPYNKKVTFELSGYSTFIGTGVNGITSLVYTVTDANTNTYTQGMTIGSGNTTTVITGLESGVLFFGQYHIKAVLYDGGTYSTIEFDTNVCYDSKLLKSNIAEGCAILEVSCSRATMLIKENANLGFAGKEILSRTTLGTVNYPIDPETQAPYLTPATFSFTPYSLDLTGSITGLYSVSLITTVNYDLGCDCILAIQYRSNINKEILCGNGMCDINCCWVESIAIVEAGGAKAVQMAELLAKAQPYYIAALQLADCGKNNDKYVDKLKSILNCDCKCETKTITITPNPITFQGVNVFGECGTTVTYDENGDVIVSSLSYSVIPADDSEDLLSMETTTADCTKTVRISIDTYQMEKAIYDVLVANSDELTNWKELLNTGCNCCEEVSITSITSLESLSTDISANKLSTLNFVKNESVTAVDLSIEPQVTGDTLNDATYYDSMVNAINNTTVEGSQLISIYCNASSFDIINAYGGRKIQSIVSSIKGCELITDFQITISKLNYSERYDFAFRFNPQIGDDPIITSTEVINGTTYTVYKLIVNDTYYGGLSSSYGGTVREVVFESVVGSGVTTFRESRTLFGTKYTGGTITTYNNILGDQVTFNYNSAPALDFTDMCNGYPAMYFTTGGGQVCRAVRETDSHTDERKNWRIYVVYTSAYFLYGIKKFKVDANGNQIFIVVNHTSANLFSFYYNYTAGKNQSTGWTATSFAMPQTGNQHNINIDGSTMYVLGIGNGTTGIKKYTYTGSSTPYTGLAIGTIGNWTLTSNVCINASASTTSFINGLGGTATIDSPTFLTKIVVSGETRFYFGNDNAFTGQGCSYLRYFVQTGGHEGSADDFTLSTEIVVNSQDVLGKGTWVSGTSTNVNGASYGFVYITGLGWISPYYKGFKLFDFVGKAVTFVTGQSGASSTLLDGTNEQMDTQYNYNI